MEPGKGRSSKTGIRLGTAAAIVVLALLGSGVVLVSRSFASLPKEPPSPRPDDKAVHTVLCLGDSLTRANISADYVGELARRLNGAGVSVINGGENGDTVGDLAARLEVVLTGAPRLDVVTVLIGTNDANQALDAAGEKGSPESAVGAFRSEYADLIARLRETANAAVVLISIPPIGEKPDSPEWSQSERYASEISGLAADTGCRYVPFFETLAALIETDPPDSERFPDHEDWEREMRRAVVHRLFKGVNYRAVGAASGYRYHSDQLHLNEDAAGILVDALERVVREEMAGR